MRSSFSHFEIPFLCSRGKVNGLSTSDAPRMFVILNFSLTLLPFLLERFQLQTLLLRQFSNNDLSLTFNNQVL